LDELTEDELLKILTLPPDSIVREYEELLALDDVRLTFQEEALRRVVRFSARKGTGARGLRAILEGVLEEVLFDAPEQRGRAVHIDGGFVEARLAKLESSQN